MESMLSGRNFATVLDSPLSITNFKRERGTKKVYYKRKFSFFIAKKGL